MAITDNFLELGITGAANRRTEGSFRVLLFSTLNKGENPRRGWLPERHHYLGYSPLHVWNRLWVSASAVRLLISAIVVITIARDLSDNFAGMHFTVSFFHETFFHQDSGRRSKNGRDVCTM
jgi:hypothetical protein